MAFYKLSLHGLGRVNEVQVWLCGWCKSSLVSAKGTTAAIVNFSALEEGYGSILSYFELYLKVNNSSSSANKQVLRF